MKNASSFITAALLFLSVISAFTPNAQAEDLIRGFIQTQAGSTDMFLTVQSDQPALKIIPSNPSLTTDLQKLKNGDYIAARGTLGILPSSVGTVELDSIESVGLVDLLGTWKSDDWAVYEFKDFTQLNLYHGTQNDGSVSLQKTGQFNYVIAPEQGDTYSIFMSDNQSVNVGSIQFQGKAIIMTVIDPKTGQTSENISLSPIDVR